MWPNSRVEVGVGVLRTVSEAKLELEVVITVLNPDPSPQVKDTL